MKAFLNTTCRPFWILGLLINSGCGYGLQAFVSDSGKTGFLNIEPSQPIDFGAVSVGDFVQKEVVLIADGSVGVEDVFINGDMAFSLAADPPVPKILQDQAELPIKIVFEPPMIQSFNGTLVVVTGGIELERRILGSGN
jgi:hypothetical protein